MAATVDLADCAWFDKNAKDAGESYAHRVAQKRANDWGLHDVHGNVSEWCRDGYAEKLPGGTDPEVTERASRRVRRGGCWHEDARNCRSAIRSSIVSGSRYGAVGFRVAAVQVGK